MISNFSLPKNAPKIRDRVLLYVRGLPENPIDAVALGMESMRQSGLQSMKTAMHSVWSLLASRERGVNMAFRLQSAPPMQRGVMVCKPLPRIRFLVAAWKSISRWLRHLFPHSQPQPSDWDKPFSPTVHDHWERAASWRRMALLALIIGPSLLAAYTMYLIMPVEAHGVLGTCMVALFAILFAWISVGFWTATAGMFLLCKRFDRFCPSPNGFGKGTGQPSFSEAPLPEQVRTVLLFPVYNEDVQRVMAGIRTVYHSLKATGQLANFDIFILSDSTRTNSWVEEEEGWYNFCLEEDAFDHLFYRRRKNNTKRKSGNVADFCRRWGRNYKYALVFDADSIMTGACMLELVRTMEIHPEVGIIQTPPQAVNRKTLIARVQQFANHLYGPLFAAGLHYWQLGDAQFWGHNAILRLEPFMKYCQLPTLSGKGPLGGDILSHDFVESALMRRAGYGVWLAYHLQGSYEESPPSLVDELTRDRRWCQGNLQHGRLVLAQGFFPTHRALFINGIMSYGSALLWLLFLVCSSFQAILAVLIVPQYFSGMKTLFPIWPTWYPHWALTVLGSTAVLLFLPKFFALALVLAKGGARFFGGALALCASMLGEVFLSTLLAPVRMLFHSYFVLATLLGCGVGWNVQNRDDVGTSWGTALRVHWWGTLVGLIWGGSMWVINPGFFWWFSPIVFGLVSSVPLSVWSSRASVGQWAYKHNLFIIPPEAQRPPELLALDENLKRPAPYDAFPQSHEGFIRAVLVPKVHALHLALTQHRRQPSPTRDAQVEAVYTRALNHGPAALSEREKVALLCHPEMLHKLHASVWELEEPQAQLWGLEETRPSL